MRRTLALLFLTLAVVAARPQSEEEAQPEEAPEEEGHHGTFIGKLTSKAHGVEGELYAKDEKTLLLKKFEYDGSAPDPFFWVGTSGKPSPDGTILPYPFKGQFYKYDDETAPIIRGVFDGTKDIMLTLPDDLTVSDLKWFSVWCRQFSANFGDLIFPEDFSLDKAAPEVPATTTTTTTSSTEKELPPPLVHPSNDLDDHAHDDEDYDVQAEPESEPESEPDYDHDHAHPVKGSAHTLASPMSALVITIFVAKFLL